MAEYVELTVTTTHEGSEIVADALWEYTDSGVVISDVQDVIELSKTGKTWDYMDDNVLSRDKTVLVKAYYEVTASHIVIHEIERKLEELRKITEIDFGTLETTKRITDGDLWREQWKEHFKPIHIDKVVIVPEWIDYQKQPEEIVIKLDSNMAFGTGEHETTSMCVNYLQKFVKKSDTVLDVGCGSGILGITASKLGANKVIMTDIDECAITATEHNMKNNDVTNGKVLLKNLLDDNTVVGDVIVCNIMAEVLIAFASGIGKNVTDDGIIILSGILFDRLDRVKKAYLENGFSYVCEDTKGEWCALVMRKVKA